MKSLWTVVLAAICLALLACTKDEAPTGIRVIVDSDLEIGRELTKLEVRVFDPAGEEEWRRQDFALSETRGSAQFTLPLSLRLAPQSQGSTRDFLLVVTGVGPLGEGGSEIEVVEQQALASFRPGETLRLDMFLAKTCLLELCRQDGERSGLSCDVQTGGCQEVPHREDLPVARGDGIEDYEEAKADAGEPDASHLPNDGGSAEDTLPTDESDARTSGGMAGTGSAQVDEPCGQDGAMACAENNSTDSLRCIGGHWSLGVACGEHQHCDKWPGASQGTCICDEGFESDKMGMCMSLDDCIGNACQHSARCIDGHQEYSCDCSGTGYEGDRCERDIDECAVPQLCHRAYRCVQTASPGYSCLGQMADWPMPDTVSGAKTIANYGITEATIEDVFTSMMWQRVLPDTYVGCTLPDFFNNAGSEGRYCSWEQARDYCENLEYAGRSDWRLPTKIELESLLDHTINNIDAPLGQSRPTIDVDMFPGTQAVLHWTSSPDIQSTDAMWTVVFGSGGSTSVPTVQRGAVRCVRDTRIISTGTPFSRYLVSVADDTVADVRVGLTWSRTVPAALHTWAEAKAYCESRSSSGVPFRLPTIKELLTLVDPVRASPAIDTKAFPSTPVERYWSSIAPAYSASGGNYYTLVVDFETGAAGNYIADEGARTRCVLDD